MGRLVIGVLWDVYSFSDGRFSDGMFSDWDVW